MSIDPTSLPSLTLSHESDFQALKTTSSKQGVDFPCNALNNSSNKSIKGCETNKLPQEEKNRLASLIFIRAKHIMNCSTPDITSALKLLTQAIEYNPTLLSAYLEKAKLLMYDKTNPLQSLKEAQKLLQLSLPLIHLPCNAKFMHDENDHDEDLEIKKIAMEYYILSLIIMTLSRKHEVLTELILDENVSSELKNLLTTDLESSQDLLWDNLEAALVLKEKLIGFDIEHFIQMIGE